MCKRNKNPCHCGTYILAQKDNQITIKISKNRHQNIIIKVISDTERTEHVKGNQELGVEAGASQVVILIRMVRAF